MDLLHNLALGFSVLADPMTIVYSLIGVVCGVIIGALPVWGLRWASQCSCPCATDLIRPVPCACCAGSTTGPCTVVPLPPS